MNGRRGSLCSGEVPLNAGTLKFEFHRGFVGKNIYQMVVAFWGDSNHYHLARGGIWSDCENHVQGFHLLANLGWVDFDWGCSTILLGQ